MNTELIEFIEQEIFIAITGDPERVFSQFELFDSLMKIKKIKDPMERENFKFHFALVLRSMPTKYDNVLTQIKNNVYYICFSVKNEPFTIDESKYSNFVSSKSETKEYNDMPREKAVIEFVVDEGVDKYILGTDYLGNTIVHYLATFSDTKRLKKLIESKKIDYYWFFKPNKEGKSPLDMTVDNSIHNMLIQHLFEEKEKAEEKHRVNAEKMNKNLHLLEDRDTHILKSLDERINYVDKKLMIACIILLIISYFI